MSFVGPFFALFGLDDKLAQVKSAQILTRAQCLEMTESRWLGLGIFQDEKSKGLYKQFLKCITP